MNMFNIMAIEGSKNLQDDSKQRFKANFYHENARITKTRHHNSYGQQNLLFWVSKTDNEMTEIFSSDSSLIESEFFLVIFSIGLGVIEQIVMFWTHMGMGFIQKERSHLQAIGNLSR